MIYAIGDIHGHLEKLSAAHRLIEEDVEAQGKGAGQIIHVGDLVDRGPDTRGVIQYLIDGIAAGKDWIVLKGNHDDLFLKFANGGDGTNPHLRAGISWQSTGMGGSETLRSYGVTKRAFERQSTFRDRARKCVPDTHRRFLANLPLSHKADGMIFVHAGIRPGFPLDAQDEDDLLWIRDEFLWHMGPHEALVVHGHTPVDEPTHYGNRINIDTGAGWGHELVPVVFDGGECFALTKNGRETVRSPDKYYQDAD